MHVIKGVGEGYTQQLSKTPSITLWRNSGFPHFCQDRHLPRCPQDLWHAPLLCAPSWTRSDPTQDHLRWLNCHTYGSARTTRGMQIFRTSTVILNTSNLLETKQTSGVIRWKHRAAKGTSSLGEICLQVMLHSAIPRWQNQRAKEKYENWLKRKMRTTGSFQIGIALCKRNRKGWDWSLVTPMLTLLCCCSVLL